VVDCRTTGCGINGECLREGGEFVCRCIPGTEGQADIECHTSEYAIHLVKSLICLDTMYKCTMV
jgi:hypothetical protein